MIMSSNDGDLVVSFVVNTAWYWMYCECPVSEPGAATGANPVQELSGTAVLPLRTLIVTLVPEGVVASHWMVCQSTWDFASNTRDVKVPGVTYGFIRIQSTKTVPPKAVKSLAATGRTGPAT